MASIPNSYKMLRPLRGKLIMSNMIEERETIQCLQSGDLVFDLEFLVGQGLLMHLTKG